MSDDTATPRDAARIDFKRMGDWTSWSAAPVVLCLLPFTLIGLWPFIAILGAILAALLPGTYDTWTGILLLAYFVVLPLLFIPRLHRLRVWLFFREAREPTTTQRARLDAQWSAVLAGVGKGPKQRFHLMVVNEPRPNAAAGAGRIVLITKPALRQLDDAQLRAIMAHEYGHHVGLHPIVLIAKLWLLVPIGWFEWLAVRIHNILATLSGMRMHIVMMFFVWYGILYLRLMLFVLNLVLRVIMAIVLYFGRHGEHKADLVAVKLGHGEALIAALEHIEESLEEATSEPQTLPKPKWFEANPEWFERTHPPTAQRIARIQAALAADQTSAN